jgi:hypothetical protein
MPAVVYTFWFKEGRELNDPSKGWRFKHPAGLLLNPFDPSDNETIIQAKKL